jgi:hypothetical protein
MGRHVQALKRGFQYPTSFSELLAFAENSDEFIKPNSKVTRPIIAVYFKVASTMNILDYLLVSNHVEYESNQM